MMKEEAEGKVVGEHFISGRGEHHSFRFPDLAAGPFCKNSVNEKTLG
jgi:hypothetical protein